MNDKLTPKDYYFFLLFLFLSILIITSRGGGNDIKGELKKFSFLSNDTNISFTY